MVLGDGDFISLDFSPLFSSSTMYLGIELVNYLVLPGESILIYYYKGQEGRAEMGSGVSSPACTLIVSVNADTIALVLCHFGPRTSSACACLLLSSLSCYYSLFTLLQQ